MNEARRVAEAIAHWNAGDLDGYLSLYHPTIRLHGYAPDPMNKAAATAFYQTVWQSLGEGSAAAPRLSIDRAMQEGADYACVFTMTGTHRGTFLGVPATGRPYRIGGVTMMRFYDDQVVQRWSCADMLGLMVQIGAVTAGEPPVSRGR